MGMLKTFNKQILHWYVYYHEVTMTNQMKNQNKLNILFFPINLHE
jgi:hypothetical protein